ncbi:lipase [Syncephalastrum racemosum]|uniref:Lipase n=1 Tax=Syncephalastrum racemosum TaxID=13706 RepID=A0A1X2HIJ3_SYNRA|nr:lipase [Syncephalastrum racemosum]
MKHQTVLIFLVLVLGLHMTLTAAVPLDRRGATSTASGSNATSASDSLPSIIPSRATLSGQSTNPDYDPESTGLNRNGKLPPGTDCKYGMAKNISSFPDTVAQSLRTATGVRIALAEEIATQKFYTTLSANAYCRSVIPGGKWDCANCKKMPELVLVKTFTTLISDTNAMILRDDDKKYIYIVFRGSNSIRNFVADFIFDKIDYPPVKGTKVHKGFYKSYMEVQKELVRTFMDEFNSHSDYKVALTGHSMGAAQALLCALDLYQRDQRLNANVLHLYTQGEPRVGDAAFAGYVLSTKFTYDRVVHERDLVPHLPPAAFGFLHAGEEFWITDKQVDVCANGIESAQCSNSIVPWTNVLDHLTYFDINVGLCL